jgi:acyl-CoA thioesterase-1
MKKTSNIFLTAILLVFCIVAIAWFVRRDTKLTSTPSVYNSAQETVEKNTIIAFGDSLTAGYNVLLSESYPAQLEAKLRSEGFSVKIINAGVSGETTQGSRERAQFIRDQNPDIVILGIGGNDALRLLPIAETKKNIESSIQTLLAGENPPKVVLLNMQSPLNSGSEYKKDFDALYAEFSKKYTTPLIPFIVPEVFLDTTYMLNDGIHPNKEGYTVLVEKYLWKEVVKLLK